MKINTKKTFITTFYSVVNRTQTGTEPHSIFGPNIGVQRVVVYELEVVAAVTSLRLPLNNKEYIQRTTRLHTLSNSCNCPQRTLNLAKKPNRKRKQ
jgi:hypothetical protein